MKHFSLLCLFILTTNGVISQTDSLNLMREVEVSEKRMTKLPFSQAARNIQIITDADIRQMPVQTLAEAISYVAGIDLRQRGPFGAQSDISLMGGSFEQVLILVNGIPMRDPQTGHHQMNLPVDLQQIDHIEILKGTAARIYGSNALAGAINIVTKDPGTERFVIQAYGASPISEDSMKSSPYGLAGCRITAGISNKSGSSSHALDFSWLRTDGYRYNSSNTRLGIGYRGRMRTKIGQIDLIGGGLSNAFGANGFYAYPFDINAYEKVETGFGGINLSASSGRWTFRPLVYLRYNHDDYIFIRAKPEVYRNNHFTTAAGAEFHASCNHTGGQFGIGYESRTEIIRSNNLGAHERYYHSVYAEERMFFGESTITAGGQVQYTNDYGLRFYPGLEFSTPIWRSLRLFGNTGLGSRLPTYTDLYYSDSANQGNPSLAPEEAFSSEAGFKYNEGNLEFTSAAFMRRTSSFIDYVRSGAGEKWIPENFHKLNFRGIDLRAAYRFKETSFFLQPVLIRSAFTGMRGQLEVDQLQSKYALNHLSLQSVSQFVFRTGKHIEHAVSFRYCERFSGQQYGLADYRIQLIGHKLTINADVNNIFDRSYIESGFIPMPGRWYRLGLEWRI